MLVWSFQRTYTSQPDTRRDLHKYSLCTLYVRQKGYFEGGIVKGRYSAFFLGIVGERAFFGNNRAYFCPVCTDMSSSPHNRAPRPIAARTALPSRRHEVSSRVLTPTRPQPVAADDARRELQGDASRELEHDDAESVADSVADSVTDSIVDVIDAVKKLPQTSANDMRKVKLLRKGSSTSVLSASNVKVFATHERLVEPHTPLATSTTTAHAKRVVSPIATPQRRTSKSVTHSPADPATAAAEHAPPSAEDAKEDDDREPVPMRPFTLRRDPSCPMFPPPIAPTNSLRLARVHSYVSLGDADESPVPPPPDMLRQTSSVRLACDRSVVTRLF